MRNSKLILILKKLSVREQSRFLKYIQSPFFNKHQDVLRLYEYIALFAPDYEDEKLEKEFVIQAISNNGIKMEDKHFYNVTSYLLELVCDFIAWLEQEKEPLKQKIAVVKGLSKRNLDFQLPATIRQHQLLQEQYPQKDANLDFEKYLFFNELDMEFLKKNNRVFDENLQLKNQHLDLFYLSSKLKIACDMASRNIVIQANYNCTMLEPLLHYLETKDGQEYLNAPTILVYYKVLKMLIKSEEQYYFDLKNGLEKMVQDFSREEAKLIYDYAENYCIRKINSGQSQYYKEFLDLYKAQLQSEILLKEGYLEERDYKNIVTVGLRLKDYEWTEQFIYQNKNKLKETGRENAFIYNLAAFYYATGQYTKALRSLHTVEFTDVTYHLGAKDIQLKSYYELEESDAFNALINAFKIYVKRNKELSPYRKEVYINYLKIAKKIENLREKKSYLSKEKFQKERSVLVEDLQQTKSIANYDWVETVLGNL